MRRVSTRVRLAIAVRFGLYATVVALASTTPRTLRADRFEFRQGGAIEADGHVENGVVTIELAGRSYVFLENDFRSIKEEPDSNRSERLEAQASTNADDWLTAARASLENGKVEEAIDLIRKAVVRFPTNDQLAKLIELLDHIQTPKPEPDTKPLKAALKDGFGTLKSTNLLLLHQDAEASAASRGTFLERILTAFYLDFALDGVMLKPPSTKLIHVEWGSREAYLAFLKRENAGAFRTTSGFFHPTYRVIIGYQADWERSKERSQATQSLLLKDDGARDFERRTLLKNEQKFAEDRGTAAHEMVHLLLATTGRLPDPPATPIWLQEGLAMQYESMKGGRWGGINQVQPYRLRDWNHLENPPKLRNVLSDEGFGQGYRSGAYAKAWALVYFLRKTYPHEFQSYLDRLALPRSTEESDSTNATIEAFVLSFGGDLRKLERQWKDFLNQTRTGQAIEGSSLQRTTTDKSNDRG